jgi:hypothetical protein
MISAVVTIIRNRLERGRGEGPTFRFPGGEMNWSGEVDDPFDAFEGLFERSFLKAEDI